MVLWKIKNRSKKLLYYFLVIIFFPNLAHSLKWSMFVVVKLSVIFTETYITLIFNHRYVVDQMFRHLFYTCFKFSTSPCHRHGVNGQCVWFL